MFFSFVKENLFELNINWEKFDAQKVMYAQCSSETLTISLYLILFDNFDWNEVHLSIEFSL